MSNLSFAFRTLFKTPFVTVVAILSLALGIGANAAIFSLFNQMLLRALPVPDPGRLVNLSAPGPKPGGQSCNQAGDCDAVFSYPMFRDLEKAQTALTGLAAHRAFDANLSLRGQTANGEGMLVSGSYFEVLGVRPVLGRLLGPEDDRAEGGAPVVVLSHAYWQTRLAGNPTVLNDTLIVNGQALTVVGVAPPGFEGTTLGQRPQVFVPITMRSLMMPMFKSLEDRRSYWAYLFGRLRPGVTLEQARTALNVPYHAIINEVEAPLQKGMSEQTLARFRARDVRLEEGWRGQSSLHGEARAPLILLFAITAIVLVIACANIANLLLVRAAGRGMEMAVRLSLGAGRRRILGQLLTESCVLGVLGGLGGLVVAHWTLRLIASLLPSEGVSSLQFQLELPVVVFAMALALGTGVLFGLFPALHSTRPDIVSTLKGQAGQPSGARSAARFRTGLVTAQIALSMALLISAGLFIKSLRNVSRVDLGLKVDNVITFGISPELNGYTPERSRVLFGRVEEELAALPGVTSVSASLVPILSGSNWGSSVHVEGFEAGPDTNRQASFNVIGPGYFRTLGIPLLAGREFTTSDTIDAPKVVIVNEAFTRKFNLGRDAVGKRMDAEREQVLDLEIVGVVPDTKYSEVKQPLPPQFFRPYRQDAEVGSMFFYVRTSLDAEQVLRSVPAVVSRLDANLPVVNLKTMPQQVRENVFLDRMISTLSAAFAALATLLAGIGLYGVLAYTVAQRTREFGLRMALGADANRVRGLVLRQVGLMTLVGGAIGIAAAIGLGRLARSLLFELESHDPVVLVASVIALATVALGAGFIPATRASRVEPMRALRYE